MNSQQRNILVSGASGMLGSALRISLSQLGYTIYALDRRSASSPFHIDIESEHIFLDPHIPLDAVINLSGEPISGKRWSNTQKRRILQSRVITTRLLSTALAKRVVPPKVFISASAIGFYGPTGDHAVDENSSPGNDFLAEVALQWEDATRPASEVGIRTAIPRFGIILTKEAGVLGEMLLPFKLGLGGVIGDGRQWMSWIALEDAVAVVLRCLDEAALEGPINVVAPEAVTNKVFTRALGAALNRPTISPVLKAPVVRLLFGEMGDALLLSSSRVLPGKLQSLGYQWQFPALQEKMQAEFGR